MVLGFLVFFYCYYCNAELLEEGTTVTTTIEGDFTVEETTTIENKSTGDVLDSNTGIVGETYEGDFDKDWGGQGPIQGMLDCTQYFDSGTCGVATGTSLTTFQQTINLDDFYIEDGGKIDWSLDFYAPSDNVNAYTEAKGYLDGILQWESGQNSLTYTANPSNYTGTYNFDGGLDRLFIAIGGYNTYYVDNASLTIQYNVITTVINQYLNIIEPTITENELIAITPIDNYNTIDNTSNNQIKGEPVVEDFIVLQPLEEFSTDETTDNITITTDLNFDNDITTTNTLPDISSPSTILVDPEPTVDQVMEEFNLDIETDVANVTANPIVDAEPIAETVIENEIEIENTETTTTTVDNTESTEINEMESTDVQTLEEEGSTTEIAKTNTTDTTESTEANSEEESTEGSESSENTLVANDNNNENETEKTEKQNEENLEEVKNEEESSTEEKEIAKNETEEKQESKKEDKEEKEPEEVAEKEPKKETQSTEKQTKEEKKQEQKQKKANAIIANITSQYDGLAQVTMLALVNALGADYNSYRQQQQITNTVPDWYEPKEIYADNFIPDPLGDYIKVRSSIMLEKMIEMQYDK